MEKIKISKFMGLINVPVKLKELALKINEIISTEQATKELVTLLYQTGTAAPTQYEIKNEIGTITWSYIGEGIYRGTCTGKFPVGYTTVEVFRNSTTALFSSYNNNVDYITVETTGVDGVASNDKLSATVLKVTVYNDVLWE